MSLPIAILATIALVALSLLAPFILAAMGRERIVEPEPCSDYEEGR